MLEMPKPDLVICHANCTDGFAASWAVYRRYGNESEYLPMSHGSEPPLDKISGKKVLFVDFSYKYNQMVKIIEASDSTWVVDHHVTAKDDLARLNGTSGFGSFFDMDKSGAVLAWEAVHEAPAPPILRYVQDRDLWKWELPNSKEVSAFLDSYKMDFSLWNDFHKSCFHPTGDSGHRVDYRVVQDGRAILRAKAIQVENLAKKAESWEILGVKVPVVNTPVMMSEVGAALSPGQPFSATYFESKGKRIWSLRSEPNGLDVSEVATYFGGGGHKHASGFMSLPTETTDLHRSKE